MSAVYLVAAIVIIFNVLDSITTHLALYKVPDHLRAEESNPIMAKLFTKNYKVAQLIKHTSISAVVAYFIISDNLYLLEIVAVMVGLVVMNNMYVLLGTKLTGRDIELPIERLQRLFHVPDRFYNVLAYGLVTITVFSLSFLIVGNI